MSKTSFTNTNPIADAINITSGMIAAPFVDALQEICGDESLQGICHAVTALAEEEREVEALQLICAFLDIINMECPEELKSLEESKPICALFVKEFVVDLKDILYNE